MNLRWLVDEKFGVINAVNRLNCDEGEPNDLIGYAAQVSDISRYLNWFPDLAGTGVSFTKRSAFFASVGEAIERYCGNHVPQDLTCASQWNLYSSGITHLNPLHINQFLPSQFQQKSFPFQPFDIHEPIHWVKAESLIYGSSTLIPASLVYLNYYRNHQQKSNTHPIMLSGIAAGTSIENATVSALQEIIERDSTMIWWIGKQKAKEIFVPTDSEVYRKTTNGTDPSIQLKWLLLPSEFTIPTVACLLVDHTREIMCIGFATRFDVTEAMLKASAEAFQRKRQIAHTLHHSITGPRLST